MLHPARHIPYQLPHVHLCAQYRTCASVLRTAAAASSWRSWANCSEVSRPSRGTILSRPAAAAVLDRACMLQVCGVLEHGEPAHVRSLNTYTSLCSLLPLACRVLQPCLHAEMQQALHRPFLCVPYLPRPGRLTVGGATTARTLAVKCSAICRIAVPDLQQHDRAGGVANMVWGKMADLNKNLWWNSCAASLVAMVVCN